MSANQVIKNNVPDVDTCSFDEIQIIQGDLKKPVETQKLIASLIHKGFVIPLFLWDHNGVLKAVDGTHRYRAIAELRKMGYDIPEIPYVPIVAGNEKDARKKILLASSVYGEVSREAYEAFMKTAKVDAEVADLLSTVDFKFLKDDEEKSQSEGRGGVEISSSEKETHAAGDNSVERVSNETMYFRLTVAEPELASKIEKKIEALQRKHFPGESPGSVILACLSKFWPVVEEQKAQEKAKMEEEKKAAKAAKKKAAKKKAPAAKKKSAKKKAAKKSK